MASTGSQARLLIGLSLGKICRGGAGLRKNLMVATVLQKARLVFMEEAKLARQQFVAPEKAECRVIAPDVPDITRDKSEIVVTENNTISEPNERLQEVPIVEVKNVSVKNTRRRTTGVKRTCSQKEEVKRPRCSPAGCRPHPPRAPHSLPIAAIAV